MKIFIKLYKLWISPLFLVLLIGSYFGGYLDLFLIAYCSAILHELTHIITALRLKIPISRIEILPFGICGRLGIDFIKSPAKELCIAAAGPLMSGILALAAHIAISGLPQYYASIEYARNINVSLMLLNLLPALPLDGGRVFKAILSMHMGAIRAYNITLKTSRAAIISVIAAAAVLLLTSDFNFSLILIGVFLLGSLASEQKNISLVSLREILYHKNKLNELSLCRAEHIATGANEPARRLLRMLSSHKYYIISVIDDNGRVIKTLTESRVLEALINQSIRIRFSDIY